MTTPSLLSNGIHQDVIAPYEAPAISEDKIRDELAAIDAFLMRHSRSTHTLRRYKTEVRRLWYWARDQGLLITELQRVDFERYEAFLRNPLPVERWCMSQKHPLHDPRWRPFTGPLSDPSIKHAFSAIQALMTTWLKDGYIRRDPLANKAPIKTYMGDTKLPVDTPVVLSNRPEPVPSRDRWFDDQMASAIRQALESLPSDTRALKAKKLQYTLIVRLLTISGMRISEAAHAIQGNLEERRNGWWLSIIGKGAEKRDIPIPSSFVVEALIPWRTFSGLPDLPVRNEPTPLVPPRFYRPGKDAITTRMALNIVKEVANMAVDFLPPDARRAAELLPRASNHWFRHSYATKLIDHGVPTKTILDTLGQSSEEILRIYDHKSEDERYSTVVNVSSIL